MIRNFVVLSIFEISNKYSYEFNHSTSAEYYVLIFSIGFILIYKTEWNDIGHNAIDYITNDNK